MSSASPAELSAAAVIGQIAAGAYPREALLTFARGFLPLSQEDLLSVLAYLTSSGDAGVSEAATASIRDLPPRVVTAFASNESVSPAELASLSRVSDDPGILGALIRNRSLPDEAVAALALRADAAVQEVIVINQARILRAPAILEALLANPGLSGDVRRRVVETREEFFDKKARIDKAREDERLPSPEEERISPDAAEEGPEIAELPLDPIADLLQKAQLEAGNTPAPQLTPADAKDPKRVSIYSRILTMSIPEKVQIAFKGDKSVRMILIRDRNRLICSAVMRNPRMSDTEVELIAGMRNVDDEVLRLISVKREWNSKYAIVLSLVKNPKAPIGVVLPLINRLTLRDLKALKDDKNVPEVVRVSARKIYIVRTQKS